jgi:thiosulfate dehydrogenase
VVDRSTFWGGQEDDLLRSVNHCRNYFMGAPDPWTRDDEEAKVLYAYLVSLQGLATPAPFDLAQRVEDLPPGDPRRGAEVYSRACRSCHGLLNVGLGTVNGAPILAGQKDESERTTERRLRTLRKVRHGVFLGESGTMPPFSREALSDGDLGSLLAYLAVY